MSQSEGGEEPGGRETVEATDAASPTAPRADPPPEGEEALAARSEGDGGQEGERRWMQRIIFYSLLGGACPLIPVPFIDDVVLGHLRRRFIMGTFRDAGAALEREQLDVLLAEPSGCALGCVATAVVYPLTKIFKKIFFFLSIKGCVDVASKLFHQGYLIQRALDRGLIEPGQLAGGQTGALTALRGAMDRTLAEVDHRPIDQLLARLFAGSRVGARQIARGLLKTFRRERRGGSGDEALGQALVASEQAPEPGMEALMASFNQAIWTERGYLDSLENRFLAHMSAPESSSPE